METLEMCRACLRTNVEIKGINDSIVYNYNLLTNLLITMYDDLPQSMCCECLSRLDSFIIFREICIKNELSLHEMYKERLITSQEPNSGPLPHEVKEEQYLDFTDEPMDYDDEGFKPDPGIKEYGNSLKVEFDRGDVKIKLEETQNEKPKRTRRRTEKATLLVEKPKAKRTKNTIAKLKDTKIKVTKVKIEPDLIKTQKSGNKRSTKKLTHFECGLCPESFPKKIYLTEHLEKHKEKLICVICDATFQDWQNFIPHRFNHIADEQKCCHLCNYRYQKERTVAYHYLRNHSNQKLNLECLWCQRSYKTARLLNRHIAMMHPTQMLICDYCGKNVPSKTAMVNHIRKHVDYLRVNCKLCTRTFKHCAALLMHRRRVHDAIKYHCRRCGRYFRDQPQMDRHDCPTVVCAQCGKLFLSVKSLKRHTAVHSEERPYQCHLCPGTFKTAQAMYQHKLRHKNLRKHKCSYCTRAFGTRAVLVKHIRTHTGEKPFVCSICGRGFTGGHNLKVHMRVHGLDLVVKKVKPEESNLVPVL